MANVWGADDICTAADKLNKKYVFQAPRWDGSGIPAKNGVVVIGFNGQGTIKDALDVKNVCVIDKNSGKTIDCIVKYKGVAGVADNLDYDSYLETVATNKQNANISTDLQTEKEAAWEIVLNKAEEVKTEKEAVQAIIQQIENTPTSSVVTADQPIVNFNTPNDWTMDITLTIITPTNNVILTFDLPNTILSLSDFWGADIKTIKSNNHVALSIKPWWGNFSAGSLKLTASIGGALGQNSVTNCYLNGLSSLVTYGGSVKTGEQAEQVASQNQGQSALDVVYDNTPSENITPTVSVVAPKPASSDAGYTAIVTTGRHYVGYFPSWSDSYYDSVNWNGQPYSDDEIFQQSKLARVPNCFTHIMLAFVKPDLAFNGQDLTGTGLDFSASISGVKRAIEVLHTRNQKALLAVGGATYNNWNGLANEAGVAINNTTYKKALYNLLLYLGADGLDVDFEIEGAPGSTVATTYAKAIVAMKEVVDAASSGDARILTLAAWSTGADYAIGNTDKTGWNSANTTYWGGSSGRERDVLLRNAGTYSSAYSGKKIRELIDEISVMTYDARFEHFDPVKSYDLYRAIYPDGYLNIGLEPAPEGWAGAVLVCNNSDAGATGTMVLQDQEGNTVNQPYSVERSVGHAKNDPKGGAMLWSILKAPSGSYATPTQVSQKVSELLNIGDPSAVIQ